MAETYSAGVVTAYGAAVRGGYTGTYEEFCAEQAEFAENAAAVAQAKTDVETMQSQVEQAAATFTGTTVPAAVTTVQEAGAAQVQAVQSEGTMQAAAVETVGAQQKTAVEAAGSDAVDAVEAAETAATDAVTAAQTAAVQAVQAESTTQQAAIQTKGQETIASIPEDYTALSGEVDDLKSAFTDFPISVVGYYKGSYTTGLIDRDEDTTTVFAECEENCIYTVEKIATNRFTVFFTSLPPVYGVEILSYRVTDNTASVITAKAPQNAKYICAYIYNSSLDSGIDTEQNVRESVKITQMSASDAVAREKIERVSEITDMVVGKDIQVSWEPGGVSLQGAEQQDLNRIRTIGFVDKMATVTNIIINNPDYQFSVRYYKDGVFLASDAAWRSNALSDVFAQNSQCNQIRVVVRKSSNAGITGENAEEAINAVSIKNDANAYCVPENVRQAIYSLLASAAYASTSNVSTNLAVLSDWASV